MVNVEEEGRNRLGEKLYTSVLLLMVALLLLVSITYTTLLWWVKVLLALVLLSFSAGFGWKYGQEKRDLK